MEMTDGEILRKYAQAKDPKKQIKILADLNLCGRDKIIRILIEQGVDPKELPAIRGVYNPPKEKPPKEKTRYTPDEAATLEREIESKLTKMVERYGGHCLKLICLSFSGFPDRTILLPGGRVVFAETKRPKGGKLAKLQKYWGRKLLDLGFEAWVLWNREDLAEFEEKVLRGEKR